MAGPPQTADKSARSTVLMIGKGETMDAALRLALDRHGLNVVEATTDPKTAVTTTAPDLVLLVGDAARDGGRAVLEKLGAGSGSAASAPVAVLGAPGQLDTRLQAFRHGAVAVVPRTASVDAIATRVAALVKDVQDRSGHGAEELGEATFDELVNLVSHELRSGILSVQGKDGEAMRIVLGAGRPVAAAVEEFVRRLRPLVSRAEPLTYEIHSPTGGAVGLLDAEPGIETDPSLLEGLRVLLVDTDPARADAIAQELRARKVVVAVADASGRGLERARGLDPEVVILDAAGIEGPGFEVVRAIRRDVRLRWASMLVAPWDDIWPTPESTPDVARLAERIAPLVENDRALRARVAQEAAFDARLESTGPCRFLRILATSPSPVHAVFRSRAAVVEIDVAEGLIVGAQGSRGAGDTLEGVRAVSALLAMGAARVHVERRANPTVANLMAPVEEALSRAAEEVAPIPISAPPPKAESKPANQPRRRPFPAASELKAQGSPLGTDDELASLAGLPRGVASHAEAPRADASDRWSDTDEPGLEPPSRASLAMTAFSTAVPGAVARPVFASKARTAAFGVPAVEGEGGGPGSPASELPAPRTPQAAAPRQTTARKATLAMGGPLPAGAAPRLAVPSPTPATGARSAPPASRNPTVTMGSARPGDGGAADGNETTAVGPAPSPRPGRALPKQTLLGVAATLTRPSVPPPASAVVEPPRVASEPTRAVKLPSEQAIEIDPGRRTPELAPGIGAPPPVAHVDDGLASLLEPGGDAPRDLGVLDQLPPSGGPADPLESLPDEAAPGAYAGALPPPLPVPEPPTAPRVEAGAAQVPSELAAPATPPVSPTPPFGAAPLASPQATATAPVARARGGARALGWLLLGVGLLSVGVVGGVLSWVRFGGGSIDALLAAVGMSPGSSGLVVTPLGPDAGASLVAVMPLPDAGLAALIPGPLDAAVAPTGTELDGGAAAVAGESAPDGGPDAGMDGGPDSGPDAGTDAGFDAGSPAVAVEDPTAPVPGETGVLAPVEGETAESLVALAESVPPAQAEVLYRRALELDPRDHHAMIGLAELLIETARAAEAIPLIEDAISRRRTRASYRVLLGDARRAVGDSAGAAAAWREALELEPDNRQARERLGN